MYSLVLATALTAGTTAPDHGYGNMPYCPPPACYDACMPRRDPACYRLAYWKPGCPLYNIFVRPFKAVFCPLPYPVPYGPQCGGGQDMYCCPPGHGSPPPYGFNGPPCPPMMEFSWVEPAPMHKQKMEEKKKKKKKEDDDDDIGTVKVLAPMEAEITFNGLKVNRKDEKQAFATPKLEAGEKFHYVVSATVKVDGKKETLTRTVVVEAGKQAEVNFQELELVLAKK